MLAWHREPVIKIKAGMFISKLWTLKLFRQPSISVVIVVGLQSVIQQYHGFLQVIMAQVQYSKFTEAR